MREHRIAMWSGPRNISTAMMRAWENRSDTVVWDEPLYAYYLRTTGLAHPGAEEIIAHDEPDWRRVVTRLVGPVPGGASISFQKHMAQHLLPELERDWLPELEHAFLLRDPREMLLSLSRVIPNPGVSDTGLPQQLELFEQVRGWTGKTPPVLDSRDVLEAPRELLSQLCAAFDIEFTEAMLSWPAGSRPTDGVWAKHWYDSVITTTGFEARAAKTVELSAELEEVCSECMPIYRTLHEQRLRA